MALIQLNKVEAVQREIDAAVRLTFTQEDGVAVHAVIAGVHRMIQDFYRARGDADAYLRLGDWIAPAHAARFWRFLDAAGAFLAAGEWDAERVFELEEDANDFLIVFAARWYQSQGYAATRPMRIFATWYVACHPGILRPEAMPEAAITTQMEAMSKALQSLGRLDRLRAGLMALQTKNAKPAPEARE